jgi:hypothetical protein
MFTPILKFIFNLSLSQQNFAILWKPIVISMFLKNRNTSLAIIVLSLKFFKCFYLSLMTKIFIISTPNYLPVSMDLTNKYTLSQILTYFKHIAPILMIFT